VFSNILAGQWHGGLLVRELDLEDGEAAVAETQFTARQIELEHFAIGFAGEILFVLVDKYTAVNTAAASAAPAVWLVIAN
jgi:transcriptional antiterminator Rof (Rho-off)